VIYLLGTQYEVHIIRTKRLLVLQRTRGNSLPCYPKRIEGIGEDLLVLLSFRWRCKGRIGRSYNLILVSNENRLPI
jgi:hypothetical protein